MNRFGWSHLAIPPSRSFHHSSIGGERRPLPTCRQTERDQEWKPWGEAETNGIFAVKFNPMWSSIPFFLSLFCRREACDLKLKQGHARAGDAVPTLTERKMRRYFVIIAMEIGTDREKIPRNRRCSPLPHSTHNRYHSIRASGRHLLD